MAFVTEAALIALREGLEALLITGILLGLVTRLGRPDARSYVWGGFAAAVATSLVAGWAVQRYLLGAFQEAGYDAWFTLVAALAAIATLLYMVFWMWQHTAQLLGEAKDRVKAALTTGSLVTIAFVTYISTVREGLETVLFYSALAGQEGLGSLAFSGAVGFAASALLVYLILHSSRHVSVRAFFTATGLWLIVVAAMLTTHVVEAATSIGLLEPAPAIWDTSGIIAGDSVPGRILHAAVGYTAAPTLLQAVLYFGVLFGAGGLYLYRQGVFTTNTAAGSRPRTGRVVAACAAVLLVGAAVAGAAANPTDRIVEGHGHGHGDDHAHDDHGHVEVPEDATVGVMLRSHGEPVHYNATTYESFKQFYRNLLETLGFEELLEVDDGTILLDRERPFAEEPRLNPDLIDAWREDFDRPATWTGNPVGEDEVPIFEGFYQAPGGPGLGEPDVLEALGLTTYQAYLQMENDSPMHHDKAEVLDLLEDELGERIEGELVIERATHVRPMLDPQDESIEASTQELVAAEPDVIVDAYTSALHSDVMNECMKEPAFRAALDEAGYDGEVVEAGPYGLEAPFAEGVADHVAERLADYPDDAHVWVSLTHHGVDPGAQSPCKDRAEPYVNQTEAMFETAEAELANRSLGPEVTVGMVYGQGADGEDDGVLSPTEALDEARDANASYVLDVPYELPGNGYDNLVQHRLGYDLDPREAPHYGPDYETELTRQGLDVTITSSDAAEDARATAQADAVVDALRPALEDLREG
jgi:high-affinity iron transporter